uniref:PB1 domain-containing protein n=1 Tax=Polytomella parva TaxID=51329 RepID=A0A7S0V5M7_9CHLO|mmetsp:Transcript_2854/g.4504  ORF Transcript_2854/g.4504 Transcript_2854/m.4504 type:complete len:687 (+) Transcript_2854:36-2096(+)
MAKKNKSTAAQAKPVQVQPVEISPEVAEKVSVLKVEATNAFAKGDLNTALSAYDKAINELPKNAVERVDFLVNKAACYILQQKQSEAIKECSAALEIQPDSARALLRRAKAYEAQSETRLALSDYSALNKTEGATDETRAAEKKLREKTIAAALAAAGAARRGPAGRPHSASNTNAAANAAANAANSPITVKVTCDNDTKLIYLPMNGTYADLLALTKAKFPAAGFRMLKYFDKDGDVVAITNTQDLLTAFQDVYSIFMKQYGRNAQTAASRMGLPPLRLVFVPVPFEADVPLGELASSSSSSAAAATAAEGVKDSWIYDFANLFASVTGLHPDAHVDLHTMGWEAVQKGLDTAIHHEEAEGLLLRAADHFRDMACLGLNNLATVHQLLANRFLDNSSKAGKKVEEVADQANVSYDRAQKHFNEALALNARHFDSVIGLSQLMFERCKVDAGLLVPDIKKPEEEAGSGEGEDSASASASSEEKMTAAVAAAQKDALALLTADRVAKSKALFTQALELADQAMAIGAEKDQEESKKKKESGASDDEAAAAAAAAEEEEASLSRQAQVVKGNFLFEWSQMQAAVNDDTWKASLDQSMTLFRAAKCPVRDLRTALRNHLKASEIELGPEEAEDERKEAEEKKAAAAAVAQVEEERKKKEEEGEAEKKKEEGVKGLPSLGKGKGKGKGKK